VVEEYGATFTGKGFRRQGQTGPPLSLAASITTLLTCWWTSDKIPRASATLCIDGDGSAACGPLTP
jgi:hypothetical protein